MEKRYVWQKLNCCFSCAKENYVLQLAWGFCAFTQVSQHSAKNSHKLFILEDPFQIATFTLYSAARAIVSHFEAYEKLCCVSYTVNPSLLRFGMGFVLLCSEAVSEPVELNGAQELGKQWSTTMTPTAAEMGAEPWTPNWV